MKGAVVELVHNPERPGLEWLIRISPSTALIAFDVAVQSKDYVSKLKQFSNYICFSIHDTPIQTLTSLNSTSFES